VSVPALVGARDSRTRRFRTPRSGDEVGLRLVPQLGPELPPGAHLTQLRESGVERLRVTVVKAPRGDTLVAEDAVKIASPELFPEVREPTLYVRLEFLDLPPI
jgi:hypothetical protein